MVKSHSRRFCAAALGVALSASATHAATLVSFKPIPLSPTTAEYMFDGTFFGEGPGSIGNGDGALAVANQSAPGLQLDTPFIINGITGSTVNPVSGSTSFYDVSFDLTGLGATIPAQNVLGTLVQPLNSGSFVITGTDGTLLLSGTITSATITGQNGGDAGASFAANTVTYTGGAIYTALITAGGTVSGNSMSLSMTDIAPSMSINDQTNFINAFSSNGEGSFTANAIPEPAMLGFGALTLLVLKRRSR